MIKKVILLCFILLIQSINISNCAELSKQQQKQFKDEMTKAINEIILYNEPIMQNYFQKSLQYYTNFERNPNNMENNKKVCDEMLEMSSELGSLDFFTKINAVLDKYKLSTKEAYNCNYYDYVFQHYLKKFKIKNGKKYINLVHNSYNKQITIAKMRDNIGQYSIKYENNKVNDFKRDLMSNTPELIDNVVGIEPLVKDKIYMMHGSVKQIFPDGFLTFGHNYYDFVVFVLTPKAKRLIIDDYFDPYLPVKYAGYTKTYKTILGEYQKAYVFKATTLKEVYNNISAKPINYKFYFITPNTNLYPNEKLQVCNERRALNPHTLGELCLDWE